MCFLYLHIITSYKTFSSAVLFSLGYKVIKAHHCLACMFWNTGLAKAEPALGHFCTDGLICNQPSNDMFTEHQVLVMKVGAAKKCKVTYIYSGLGMVSHSVM